MRKKLVVVQEDILHSFLHGFRIVLIGWLAIANGPLASQSESSIY